MNVITDVFDRVYIAKYAEQLGIPELSKSFETTNLQIINIIEELKTTGVYGYYKDMRENEWENLSGRSKKRQKELINEGYIKYTQQLFEILVNEFKEEYPVFEKYYNPSHTPIIKITGEDEEWKKIEGLCYSISNYGRIRNDNTKQIKKPKINKGIVQINLCNKGTSQTFSVSRLVAMFFIRTLEKGERIKHIDGQVRNNYYKNLEIVSK